MKNPIVQYTKDDIDKMFSKLVSSDNALKIQFEKYIKEEYFNEHDLKQRLNYIDIAHISRYIIDRVLKNETEVLAEVFNNVEEVLSSCDEYVDNLIIIGLFEGIQNIGGAEIDYYFGFNKWLMPKSRTKWDGLIDSWEGTDWRKTKKRP